MTHKPEKPKGLEIPDALGVSRNVQAIDKAVEELAEANVRHEALGQFSQVDLNIRYGKMIEDLRGGPDQGNILFIPRSPREIIYAELDRQKKVTREIILNPATEGDDVVEKTKYNYMYSTYPQLHGKPMHSVFDAVRLNIPSHEVPGLAHAKIFLDNPSLIPQEMKTGERFYLLGAVAQDDTGASIYCLVYNTDERRLILWQDGLSADWDKTDTILRFHK
jgi:hypothetical protein